MQKFNYVPVKYNDMTDASDEVLYSKIEQSVNEQKKLKKKKYAVMLTSIMDTVRKKIDDSLPYDMTSTFAEDFAKTINWKAHKMDLPLEARSIIYDFVIDRFDNWDLPPLVIGKKPEGVDFILDRLFIKHSVKSYVKSCAAVGVQVLNNPFRTNNSKHADFSIAYERGYPIPVTAIELPFSELPIRENKNGDLIIKKRIVDLAKEMGFPKNDLVFKQADGGGWSNVFFIKAKDYKNIEDAYKYLTEKYMSMKDKLMNLQVITNPTPKDTLSRCFKIGDKDWGCSLVYPYNMKTREYQTWDHLTKEQYERIKEMSFSLSHNLGYDLNTSEWIVDEKTGHISAIDFTNETPDMNHNSLGDTIYTRVLHNIVNYVIFRTFVPRSFEEYQSLK